MKWNRLFPLVCLLALCLVAIVLLIQAGVEQPEIAATTTPPVSVTPGVTTTTSPVFPVYLPIMFRRAR